MYLYYFGNIYKCESHNKECNAVVRSHKQEQQEDRIEYLARFLLKPIPFTRANKSKRKKPVLTPNLGTLGGSESKIDRYASSWLEQG